jgi:hypothetical protein
MATRIRSSLGIVVLAWVVWAGTPTFAATLHVELNNPASYSSIQDAIDAAKNLDTVVVHPGLYPEAISYKSKAITVRSLEPNEPRVVAATVIDGGGQSVVTFQYGETERSILRGFTIQGGENGVRCVQSYARPVIRQCVITSNKLDGINGGSPTVVDCLITANAEGGMDAFGGDARGCIVTGNGSSGIYCVSGVSGRRASLANCVISGNKGYGINCGSFSLVDIVNCTIVWNQQSGVWVGSSSTEARVGNSIIAYNLSYGFEPYYSSLAKFASSYNNLYANVSGDYRYAVSTPYDICENPWFVDNGYWDKKGVWHNGDYHLLSVAGRWDPLARAWVLDPLDSPCLDQGDPNQPLGAEPVPHGGRLNLGAYGGAAEASKSKTAVGCRSYPTMDFNHDCKVDQADLDIFLQHWLECNLDPSDGCWPQGLPPTPRVQP